MPAVRRRVLACALALALLAVLPAQAIARRADVAALQVGLKKVGLLSGVVDGVDGPATRAAVRRLQQRNGLTVDGIAGPRTRRTLGRWGRPALGSRPIGAPAMGWDVSALQFLLMVRGFSPGPIDGGFGSATGRAVLAYQRSAGLPADGIAGPGTIGALRRGTRALSAPVSFFRPVRGTLGDGFGWVSGRRHTGIDFTAAQGTRVGAAGRGTTLFAGWNSGGYGKLVVVQHRLGFTTWYAHLSRITTSPGERLSSGTRIGLVGSTGRSTGPHLHFEVRRFDAPMNPRPMLLAGTATAHATAGPTSLLGPPLQGDSGTRRRIARARLVSHTLPER